MFVFVLRTPPLTTRYNYDNNNNKNKRNKNNRSAVSGGPSEAAHVCLAQTGIFFGFCCWLGSFLLAYLAKTARQLLSLLHLHSLFFSLSSSLYKSQLKLALFTLSLNKTHKKCFALARSACTSDDYHHYEITATTVRRRTTTTRAQAQQEHTKAILHITLCLCGGICVWEVFVVNIFPLG